MAVNETNLDGLEEIERTMEAMSASSNEAVRNRLRALRQTVDADLCEAYEAAKGFVATMRLKGTPEEEIPKAMYTAFQIISARRSSAAFSASHQGDVVNSRVVEDEVSQHIHLRALAADVQKALNSREPA
ncbi:MAG: hypothetical protein A3J37_03170 [Alphaproteobacteria bacterium RIFCSPHIGHO2_12_FULL_45_9]|nr:MAG: hypothetical protein A3B66_00195 [Alphaproteobacteria bacterium RIFCSPHIGHO2_02_FULL_46_13]OFW97421.1 MAG: hypothetical protein A3J37_03170 [Alphaproteobacteria bacterium RIFCSPHIGHO2_12_FULL_45_9]